MISELVNHICRVSNEYFSITNRTEEWQRSPTVNRSLPSGSANYLAKHSPVSIKWNEVEKVFFVAISDHPKLCPLCKFQNNRQDPWKSTTFEKWRITEKLGLLVYPLPEFDSFIYPFNLMSVSQTPVLTAVRIREQKLTSLECLSLGTQQLFDTSFA